MDSGTDLNILPCSMTEKLQGLIDKYCQLDSEGCRKIDQSVDGFNGLYVIEDAGKFFGGIPPILIELGGKVLETPFSNYFWKLDEDTWVLAVMCR